jgi:hypothetical protein
MPGDAPRSFREAPSFTPKPAENEAAETGEPATAETPEPAVIVEVNGEPAAQHPVRATGELSVLRTPERAVGLDTRLPDALWAYDNYPVAENVPPADDQAGVVSLGYIGAAVKRKKKIWLATTAIGVLIAGGLFTTYHPKYTDSTTTNDLLTFTATARTATAAYNEANALATTFLQYRAQTELEKESANTAAQDKQVAQTQQTVSSLNSQIRSLKANGAGSGGSRLTRLQTDLVNAQTLLTSLQQNVASTESTQRSTTAGLIAGSSVLDTGIPAEGISQKKFAIEYGGGAIFGGLVLGLLIAAISAIVSDRLRRRDDVAAAIGAPVRVSVASGGGKRSRKAAQEADLKRVAAHLRGAVPSGSDGAGSLAVVAVDDKKFVSEAIREMAVTTGREGKRVVLVDLADGALGALFGTKEPGIRGVDVSGVRVVLVTPERGDLAPVGPLHEPMLGTPMDGITNVHTAADLFITLATVKPATGAAHLKTWADDAVAVVTAGKSSVAKVQAVGEMIRFADARLDSAILLGADEKDESLGFVTA